MHSMEKTARYGNTRAVYNKHLTADFIKTQLSPRDFYPSLLLNLKIKHPDGWNDGGLCPFHDDNRTGSFRINLATGAYKCFACGVSGGDIIAFTMTLYGVQFVDALAMLSEDWGLA